MESKEDKYQENTKKIVEEIRKLDVVNYDAVSALLPKLLAEGSLVLDCSRYTPGEGVGRYLIYDHHDAENPFSIWIFAFAKKQKTSIHDHEYRGTVTVLEGQVCEKYYQPTGKDTARFINSMNRYRFDTTRDNLNGDFVHQLKYSKGFGEGISITLHIYNMEAHVINNQGEKTDRRNLKQIYFKDKREENSISTSQGDLEDESLDSRSYSL